MPPEDPRKPPEIDTSNLVAKPGRSRDTDPETLKRYGAAVLAALLLFCIVLTAVMSPPKEAGKGRLFEERKPDAPLAPEDKPWIERLMTLSPWGGGHAETAASEAAPSSSPSADNAAWSAAVAAAKAGVSAPAKPFAAPHLASGGLPGLGSSGGSSGASAPAARSDGVFRGEGGTGMIVGDLKHAAARAAWRGGPKVSAEDMKGFSAQQVDVLQNTHAGSFAVAPGGGATGAGGLGPGDKPRQGGAEPALDEKKQPNLADSKTPHEAEKQKSNMPTPSMGGGKPGQTCQELGAINDKPPTGGAPADQSYTQAGISQCKANQDLAQHPQLKNGDSDNSDAQQCAATCNKGAAAASPASSGPASQNNGGTTSSQDSHKGYSQLQKEADQKIKELAKRAKDQCVDPNGQAADLIGKINQSDATTPLGQAAAVPDGMEGGSEQQTKYRTSAMNAATDWNGPVSQAQNLHERASSACRQLAQRSTTQPVDDKLSLIDKKLQQDQSAIDRARRENVNNGQLTKTAEETNSTANRYDQERSAARDAYQRSKQKWDAFKNDLTQGSISQNNQRTGQLVSDAQLKVRDSISSINSTRPGTAASFSDAQTQVNINMGTIAGRDVGHQQALQAVNKAGQ